MTKKTYLVTGGAGFIGSAIVRRLVRAGHRVRTLDNNVRGRSRRIEDIAETIELIEADIRDAKAVRDSAKGCDSVVHLAYLNGTEFFYQYPELILDIGVRGMLNVLDACRAHDVGELVLASSSEVYQEPPFTPTPESVPLTVPDPLNPRYSYGGGKLISELLALNWGRNGFERVMVFRPHNVYGPDMGWEHVVPDLGYKIWCAHMAQPEGVLRVPLQGDGRQTRAFVFIEDFVDGVMTMFTRGEHLNIYNIGRSEEVAVEGVGRAIAAYFGREIVFDYAAAPAGGTRRRCPDISKLAALGYAPQTSLEEGLKVTLGWYAVHFEQRASDRAETGGALESSSKRPSCGGL